MMQAPKVRRVLVGSALRRHRENTGLTLEDAARILECDRSKISRIETGHRGLTRAELRLLLAEYGATGPEADALAALAGRGDCWPQYHAILPGHARDLLALELAATEITVYSPQHIPALLQTPGYAITTADPTVPADDPTVPADDPTVPADDPTVPADDPTVPADDHDQHAGLTLARRDTVLDEHKTIVTAVIGDAALRSAPDEIMRDQIRYLATATMTYPGLTLQILPQHAVTAAGGSGPVTFLRLGAATAVVHLPGLAGGSFLSGDTDIDAHTTAFTRLEAAALTPHASAALLHEISR
jgi:transcriptional regulator with XRE-family HTH domain